MEAVHIRPKLEAVDDMLTQTLDSAQALEESTNPAVVARAMRDAELAEAITGKTKQIADLLRESVTPPVVG